MKLRNANNALGLAAILTLLLLSPTIMAEPNSSGFQPGVVAQLRHEDNVRRTPSQYEQGDTILLVKPELPLLWDFGKHTLNAIYEGEYAKYINQGILNYNDHKLGTHLRLDHSNRLNSELELGVAREHDSPGDNNVIANRTAEPNRRNDRYAKAALSYGTPQSIGQLIGRLDFRQRRYTNNGLHVLDHNRSGLSGVFYYRIAPKTRLPFEVSVFNYNYHNTPSPTDPSSYEYKLLTGVTWDATAITSGIFQLGLLEKKYQNSVYKDITILTLRLDGVWKPNTYTKMVFGVIRDTQESSQAFSSGYVQNNLHTEITHMATPRTSLVLGTFYTATSSKDLTGTNDNRFSIRLAAKYSVTRWLYIGAGYEQLNRNSDLDYLDFNTHIFSINAEAQFNK